MSMPRSRAGRRPAVSDLAQRLEEAEATLAAIRSGEIDALVVSGTAGEQIYTLASADHPYRVLVEKMREGAVMVGDDGVIVYANPYFARMIGQPAETILGTEIERYLAPEDHALARELLREGEGQSAECHLVATSGDPLPVYLSASRLETGGRSLVCIVVTDLSADKRRDAAERARADAEAANRAKDDFLAIVSHELRSPLSAVLTWVHVLRSGTLDKARTDHALETVERSVRQQTRIIEDLLDVSRIVTGQLALDFGTVELATVVEAAVEAVREAASAAGIHIDLAIDAHGVVRGDAARLGQVVDNLLSNAIKFTPGGGTIRVALDQTGPGTRLVVQDTGAGIDPQFLPYVFQPFRQADTSATRRHGGLGLGLSIVRHIVELHGGSVSATNASAGGAALTVTLPVERSSLDRARFERLPARSNGTPNLSGIRVLVVDDDQSVRDGFAAALTAWGADVVTAGSATEALQRLAHGRSADILISDIAMPGADGYSLLRRVRTPDGADGGLIPAIAVSGYATAADRQRAMVAGFQAHLPKPVEPDDLAATVARLARGS